MILLARERNTVHQKKRSTVHGHGFYSLIETAGPPLSVSDNRVSFHCLFSFAPRSYSHVPSPLKRRCLLFPSPRAGPPPPPTRYELAIFFLRRRRRPAGPRINTPPRLSADPSVESSERRPACPHPSQPRPQGWGIDPARPVCLAVPACCRAAASSPSAGLCTGQELAQRHLN